MKSSSSFEMSQDTVSSSKKSKINVFVVIFFCESKTNKEKEKCKKLTNFQPGERIVDDADQHAVGLHVVGLSIEEEAALSFPGCFDQNVTPVEVPEASMS